jgi:fluoride exporter
MESAETARKADDSYERSVTMPKLVLIGLGGCCGAIARYSLSGLAHRWTSGTFPVGTLLVNVLGCFAIGVVMGLIEDKNVLGPTTRLLLVIGFLGSFTTFSSLGYETVALFNDGRFAVAALNSIGNYGLGIGAVVLGRLLVRAVIA